MDDPTARETVLRRFAYVEDENGCHVWQRAKNTKGYGVIWFEGKLHLAHRVVWLLHYGDWPSADRVTDHICENKACVRLEHLRELTNSQNILRAHPRGDARTEHRREINRRAKAKYRAKLKAGGSNPVV